MRNVSPGQLLLCREFFHAANAAQEAASAAHEGKVEEIARNEGPRINDQITSRMCRLIGVDGSQLDLPADAPSNVMFAQYSKGTGNGKIGGSGSHPRVTINVGSGYGPGVPRGLGDFMGGYYYGGSYAPSGRGVPRSSYGYGQSMGDLMLNIGLGALLGTLSNTTVYTTPQTTRDTTARTPQTTLRGYRLVEDVVPLNSPIYCIGELYHVGTDVYMGRSLDENYPTSYFATKPEAEVLASLKS